MQPHFIATSHSLRKDIQGLRAIAVLAVIFFHANSDWVPGGFIGVDIFFVISGYLITSNILCQKQNNRFSFKLFYLNRVKRIVPAYIVLLAIVTLCMAILLTPEDFGYFNSSLWPSLYFASNQYFASFGDYFAPNSSELPLLHTWSLAVEMQFYLLLPFIIIYVPSRYLKMALPTIIILSTTYASYQMALKGESQEIYFSLVARVPEFIIGSWLSLTALGYNWTTRLANFMAAFGLVLIVGSAFFIEESLPFPGFMALPPCLGAAMIIAAHRSKTNQLISNPVLVWIGGLSYSLYLWHWPVLAGIRYYIESYDIRTSVILIIMSLTLVLSCLSCRWVEIVFRSSLSVGRSICLILVFSLCAILIIKISFNLNQSLIELLPVSYTRYAAQKDICHGKMTDDCFRGNKNSENKLLLLGDSHAAQLNYFADVVGQKNNLAIEIVTASNCVTIPGFDVNRLVKWAQNPCLTQIEEAKRLIKAFDTIILAGMWTYQTESEDFLLAFDNFLTDTDKLNKSVIVLAQIPLLASNPQRLNRFEKIGLPINISLDSKWKKANELIAKIVSQHTKARFINLSNEPVFAEVPFFKGKLIYHDKSHLNEIGSRYYGAIAVPYFKNLRIGPENLNKSLSGKTAINTR